MCICLHFSSIAPYHAPQCTIRHALLAFHINPKRNNETNAAAAGVAVPSTVQYYGSSAADVGYQCARLACQLTIRRRRRRRGKQTANQSASQSVNLPPTRPIIVSSFASSVGLRTVPACRLHTILTWQTSCAGIGCRNVP